MNVGYRSGDRIKAYVALFRGINVGGNNILSMKDLVTVREKIGARNVETYIQSGNVVLRSKQTNASLLSKKIGAAIKKSHGFEPRVFLLGSEEVEKAVRSNPFPEAESDPKTLHAYFLASTPKQPDIDALEGVGSYLERFVLADGVFYLHAPDGIGRSKLAANAGQLLGVAMTGRNWRTIRKVMTMARRCG